MFVFVIMMLVNIIYVLLDFTYNFIKVSDMFGSHNGRGGKCVVEYIVVLFVIVVVVVGPVSRHRGSGDC